MVVLLAFLKIKRKSYRVSSIRSYEAPVGWRRSRLSVRSRVARRPSVPPPPPARVIAASWPRARPLPAPSGGGPPCHPAHLLVWKKQQRAVTVAGGPSGWVGRGPEAGAQEAGGWRWLWPAPSGKVAVDLSTPAERGALSRGEPGWAEQAAHGCLQTPVSRLCTSEAPRAPGGRGIQGMEGEWAGAGALQTPPSPFASTHTQWPCPARLWRKGLWPRSECVNAGKCECVTGRVTAGHGVSPHGAVKRKGLDSHWPKFRSW